MDLNEKVRQELSFVPVEYKNFRALYQRERLKALSKNEQSHVFETFFRLKYSKVESPRVSAFMFQEDILRQIRDLLPIDFLMEYERQDIMQWSCLPSGEVIAIIKPSNFSAFKDFCIWPSFRDIGNGITEATARQNNLHSISIDHGYGSFQCKVHICNLESPLQGGRVHNLVLKTKLCDEIPTDIELEIKRYYEFLEDIKTYISNLKQM